MINNFTEGTMYYPLKRIYKKPIFTFKFKSKAKSQFYFYFDLFVL